MIAFLIGALDVRGGTHKQLLKLIEYTEKQGVDFYIVTFKLDLEHTYPEFKKYKDKIRVVESRKRMTIIGKIFQIIQVTRKLRDITSDASIINIHDPGFELFLGAFKGKTVIWQVNDLPPVFRVGISKMSKITFKQKLRKWITCNNLKFVDEYVVNVTKNADRIKDCFNREAHVFYCGIEPVGIRKNIETTFNRFNDKKVNILTSGVFFPYRNYETQISVIKKLREKGIDANLHVIGKTESNPQYALKIASLIKEKELNDYITICGQVDDRRFKQLHGDSDIFIFINIDQSWGLAVFEAMSCGLPVIVSESVGATEILHNGVDSIFVNPLDEDEIVRQIERLINDKDLYTKLSEVSSSFYLDYTWDNAYCSKMFNLLSQYLK